ncbi:hypothetical protein DFJ73DRAFT_800659 [Zopfochytrium polystomum]|nr:hypothetical protein DFJ73DRAFT_800659 [Zopfochytrium polystomum]
MSRPAWIISVWVVTGSFSALYAANAVVVHDKEQHVLRLFHERNRLRNMIKQATEQQQQQGSGGDRSKSQ